MCTVANKIAEQMEVVCCQGGHVGTVDHVEGDQIKLTRQDSPDGAHHLIPTAIVAMVDTKVHLTKSGDELERLWKTV